MVSSFNRFCIGMSCLLPGALIECNVFSFTSRECNLGLEEFAEPENRAVAVGYSTKPVQDRVELCRFVFMAFQVLQKSASTLAFSKFVPSG
jgi:hypothetical protein